MKKFLSILCAFTFASCASTTNTTMNTEQVTQYNFPVHVTPISHATMLLRWDALVLYTDPVGGKEAFAGQPKPDIIFLTDIHGDHLDLETLSALTAEETVIIAPQAVFDELEGVLPAKTRIVSNDQTIDVLGFTITGVPMYNVPESPEAYHTKGRGNGYIIEREGVRVYISGDTDNTPEVRALQNIDIAFVSMNMPYTMDPVTAAEAVLAFVPKQVYPYHYRESNGLADVAQFAATVQAANPKIEVIQRDWYPVNNANTEEASQ